MKVVINSDITNNIKLTNKNIYIITNTVNVINNSTVEVEKDTLINFENYFLQAYAIFY